MSLSFSQQANSGICDLKPYQPGKPTEELQRELGITEIVKLASNENPLGPSPKAVSAAQQTLAEANLYPDGSGHNLKKALQRLLDVDVSQITLGNGSDNVISLITQTFLAPGAEVVLSEYAFAAFYIAVKGHHGAPVFAPAKNWGHDLKAMAAAITAKTKLVFIANPNNPTGTWFTERELTDFLDAIPPHVLVVLDEAYLEYAQTEPAYSSGLKQVARYPNLIVTRTFSKIYGLAGLRIGYGVSHPEIADLLNRVRLPFNLCLPALAAAEAALSDPEHVERSLKLVKVGREQFEKAFSSMRLNFIPSLGNFITVDVGRDAQPVYEMLLRRGFIVRPLLPYRMPEHLRITIGTERQNEQLIGVLREVLAV